MAIARRENMIDEPEGAVWRMFELESKRKWEFAVDNIVGTYKERKAWLTENKISSRRYAHMNNMICFFHDEEAAIMYYLRWGRYGNLHSI